MNNFKLLAIRPLQGTSENYIKNLKPDEIYQFHQDYEFIREDEQDFSKVTSICYNRNSPDNLYKIVAGNNEINVQISAIVGKNGSGKSSLLELFYLTIFCISSVEEVLAYNEQSLRDQLLKYDKNPGHEISKEKANQIKEELEDLISIYENIKTEVYYYSGDRIYCLRFDYASLPKTTVYEFIKHAEDNEKYFLHDENSKLNFHSFFYSIAVNYSIYGLNSNIIGNWVTSLFHKNDGYQVPLVLTPFREEGQININTELHLANTRLICNLLDDNFQTKEVLKGKFAERIIFRLPEERKKTLFNYISLSEAIERLVKKQGKNKIELFQEIFIAILKVDQSVFLSIKQELPYFDKIVDYVLGKVLKIAHYYNKYIAFRTSDDRHAETGNQTSPFPSITDFNEYIKELSTDGSHVTLKLRQILNVIRFNILEEDDNVKWINNELELSIDELIKRVRPNVKKDEIKLIEVIPAAFFVPEIIVSNHNGTASMQRMSSGELQFVHTLQSIYYHIIFIDSVHDSNENKMIKYRSINIMFDEVELYFHPEFQKAFVAELLSGLSKLSIESIKGINVLFTTHSPLILSDIPITNLLRLVNGSPDKPDAKEQTFGSNIHELLANDFYMEDGLLGEVAREKISKTLNWLKKQANSFKDEEIFEIDESIKYTDQENDRDYNKQIIELIGEPVIKYQLKKMYLEFVNDNEYLDKEIEKLRKLKR